MAELLEESGSLSDTTVGIFRTAATVKGGRRFSFSALVVTGDRQGRVGYGYGKSNEVPSAVEKAQKKARKAMHRIERAGSTIHHEVEGRYRSSIVRLIPASPGTGVVAGAKVRAVLEAVGVTDCLTKSFGSNNPINLVKAVMDGLHQLRTPEEVAGIRGVEIGTTTIQAKIERGQRFMSSTPSGEKMRAPENTIGRDRRGGGGRGGRGGRGGGGGGRSRVGGGGETQGAPDRDRPAPESSEGGES